MQVEQTNPSPALPASLPADVDRTRGQLKIFLGMAPGVGKTYAMLQSAHERATEGVDVLIGCVETHDRADTKALLRSLPFVIEPTGGTHAEPAVDLDLDAILARHPQVVLVDDFAHTNVPAPNGLPRHRMRYQDVIELLEAGIDVYTTVNVQHFASRADAVRQITGVTITDTIPDSLLDLADEIELIDLSPEELRKRLLKGKIHVPEGVENAANDFFRLGNLTALREMALRLTAEHVDHQLQNYMQAKQITGPWKSRERLMVAVSASPYSTQLIRWTRRMAYALEASWFAATVETTQALTPEMQRLLARNLALARELGGEVISAAGDAVDTVLLQLARQHNITQMVIGKPRHNRFYALLRGSSLVDSVIRNSGDIDVYVVTGEEKHKPQSAPRWSIWRRRNGSTWRAYLWALAIVALATVLNWVSIHTFSWVEYQVVGLTGLLTVLLIATYIGRGPALLAALVSAISFNFFFIDPHYTFAIKRFQDIVLIALYFLIAIFAGNLTARIRQQEQRAQRNVQRIMSLYRLARETATATDLDAVLRTAVDQLQQSFDADVAILLAPTGALVRTPHAASTLALDEQTFSAAQWVFTHGRPAGRFTDTLPTAAAHFVPLRTPNRIAGVIGLAMRNERRLTFEQELQLETFVNQIALVVERQLLDHAARQSALLQESERLHATLLNSISHELRTPIATIRGVTDLLANPATNTDPVACQALLTDVGDAAQRLNHLVENLLDMSRLDAGRLQIKREWCVVSDVVGVAVQRLSCLANRPLMLDIPSDLPLVQMDFSLMEQVLSNLLHNVCNYTPPDSLVEIRAAMAAGWLRLTVADRGPGIPPALLERIFDKFYRLPGTATGGTGLGLSICRGLVHAHGGELTVSNRPEGGTCFTIQLPATATPPPVKEAEIE
jgi:two-component system sensor histidine kinase KdpD